MGGFYMNARDVCYFMIQLLLFHFLMLCYGLIHIYSSVTFLVMTILPKVQNLDIDSL